LRRTIFNKNEWLLWAEHVDGKFGKRAGRQPAIYLFCLNLSENHG
jgi:hypothetical protein